MFLGNCIHFIHNQHKSHVICNDTYLIYSILLHHFVVVLSATAALCTLGWLGRLISHDTTSDQLLPACQVDCSMQDALKKLSTSKDKELLCARFLLPKFAATMLVLAWLGATK